MLDRLYIQNPWLAYGLSTAVVLVAAQLGHLIGTFWRRRNPEAASPEILTLEGAALGLVALMIGFSFSMALSRLDARLSGVVNEANAIGTTAPRARMLPEPQASDAKRLLREYVQLRIDLGQAPPSRDNSLERAIGQSNQLQAELWRLATAVTAADPRSIPAGLFVQSLNEMIDLQEKRLAAARNRVPAAVFVLLYAIAAVAIGFSGYVSGLGDKRGRIPITIMAVLVASVIGMIGDLDRSRGGFITVGQQAMHNLGESMER